MDRGRKRARVKSAGWKRVLVVSE